MRSFSGKYVGRPTARETALLRVCLRCCKLTRSVLVSFPPLFLPSAAPWSPAAAAFGTGRLSRLPKEGSEERGLRGPGRAISGAKVLIVQVVRWHLPQCWHFSATMAAASLPGATAAPRLGCPGLSEAPCAKVHLVQLVKWLRIYCPECSFWHMGPVVTLS